MNKILSKNKNVLLYKKNNSTKKRREDSSDKFNSLLAELNVIFSESSSVYGEYLDLYEGGDYAAEQPR